MTFKKGQRVIYAQQHLFESYYYGKIGTVLGVDKKHPQSVVVQFDEHKDGTYIDKDNLEPHREVVHG